jgi:hypothetical protein
MLQATGTVYMIGLDGTEASKRAFQMLVGHILKPTDFVYLIASAFPSPNPLLFVSLSLPPSLCPLRLQHALAVNHFSPPPQWGWSMC